MTLFELKCKYDGPAGGEHTSDCYTAVEVVWEVESDEGSRIGECTITVQPDSVSEKRVWVGRPGRYALVRIGDAHGSDS